MGMYPLLNALLILVIASALTALLGSLIVRMALRKYSAEERNNELSFRIFIAAIMIFWAVISISGLIYFREYL